MFVLKQQPQLFLLLASCLENIIFQLYVNNAAYVYNEETGEIEMLSQVDSVDDLQVRILPVTLFHYSYTTVLKQEHLQYQHHDFPCSFNRQTMQRPDSVLSLWMYDKV